ncbi:MAG: hypothetical protein V4635_06475 [Bacteroidota bacterium]
MKRPKIISFICIVGYLSVLLAFPQVFSPQVKKLGALMPALFGVLVAANFIACVGIWYYKQWGVQLYLLSFFAKILFNLSIDDLGFGFYFNLTLTVLFIFALLRFYPKMDRNL